jgi:hypothetical protein
LYIIYAYLVVHFCREIPGSEASNTYSGADTAVVHPEERRYSSQKLYFYPME